VALKKSPMTLSYTHTFWTYLTEIKEQMRYKKHISLLFLNIIISYNNQL
jgi:hypothetical protein